MFRLKCFIQYIEFCILLPIFGKIFIGLVKFLTVFWKGPKNLDVRFLMELKSVSERKILR